MTAAFPPSTGGSDSSPAPTPGPVATHPALAVWSAIQPFVVLFVVVATFWLYGQVQRPDSPFLSSPRMATIAKQTAIVGMGALGMTVIIISGGIDLSAGAILALASVALAKTLADGMSPGMAVLVTLLLGCAAGVLNGLLVTGLRLVPFIVTLGNMLVFRGLAEQLARQQKITVEHSPSWIASLLDTPPVGSYRLMATGAWLVVLLAAIASLVMRYTIFGRHVYAIGSNEATARLCGVSVPRTKVIVYAIGGLFMAMAGIYSFSDLNSQGDPGAGLGLELDIIAAVVIGGGSLSGGRGSLLGSIIGALTMTTLRSGCVYVGVSDPIQKIIIGAIIIAAVSIDQLTQRRRRG